MATGGGGEEKLNETPMSTAANVGAGAPAITTAKSNEARNTDLRILFIFLHLQPKALPHWRYDFRRPEYDYVLQCAIMRANMRH